MAVAGIADFSNHRKIRRAVFNERRGECVSKVACGYSRKNKLLAICFFFHKQETFTLGWSWLGHVKGNCFVNRMLSMINTLKLR